MTLQISQRELFYHRKNFYDTMRDHGIPCKVYSICKCQTVAYDLYNDIDSKRDSYDSHIETRITYEEFPTIKTLKSLGWYVDSESSPAIGYIPVLYQDKYGEFANFEPSIDDRIEVRVNPHDRNSSVRSFLIKDFVGNGFPSVVYYTVKLVPYWEDEPDAYEY